MTEPDVALTDYALFLLNSFWAWKISRSPDAEGVRSLWVVFFASIAFGSLTGGTVHGFFLDETTLGNRLLWSLTLVAIGVTAASSWMLFGHLISGPGKRRLWFRLSALLFLIYLVVLFFVSQSFQIVIFNYLPPVFLLMLACLWALRQGRGAHFGWIAGGIFFSFGAAYLQQAKIAIHPQHFNHNSTYHLVQAFALFIMYRGVRAWLKAPAWGIRA